MKIPYAATIPPEKLIHYLLVPRPKNDKSKFLARAGFTLENPEALEAALRELIRTEDATKDRTTEYGEFYQVEGNLMGPAGQLLVVTVWIVRPLNNGTFRFVTLKPGRKSQP